jgi:hypothetical protein
MKYRTVCFTVPVEEEAPADADEEARRWVRRELQYERLLDALHTARTAPSDAAA